MTGRDRGADAAALDGSAQGHVTRIVAYDVAQGQMAENVVILSDGTVCTTLLRAGSVWLSVGDVETPVPGQSDAIAREVRTVVIHVLERRDSLPDIEVRRFSAVFEAFDCGGADRLLHRAHRTRREAHVEDAAKLRMSWRVDVVHLAGLRGP
jgi:hypothetical protein